MAITFEVPTVDISGYLKDSESSRADEIVREVRNACKTSGFFQIVGHGIPRDLQEQVMESARALFALDLEEKMKLKSPFGGRGYEVIGGQMLEADTKPDLKEVRERA
jgi:isopenicillin N synthase-like dioxygenase